MVTILFQSQYIVWKTDAIWIANHDYILIGKQRESHLFLKPNANNGVIATVSDTKTILVCVYSSTALPIIRDSIK